MKTKISMIMVLSTLMCFSVANAQNFGTMAAEDEVNSAPVATNASETTDNLTPEQVENIIKSEGVPLTRVKNSSDLENIESSKYTLGPDDIIEISVMRHPEVSGAYMINNEGKIQYEFVGDLIIAGKTKEEVAEIVEQSLVDYIISPEVTVKIVGYNSKLVYVIGEVGNPGKIFMRGDTMTVSEALVEAGLPLLSANTPHVSLITPSADGKPLHRKVNVYKLLYQGDLRENLVMKPGDTLYVPPTMLAKVMRVIQPVAAPIGTTAGTATNVRSVGF